MALKEAMALRVCLAQVLRPVLVAGQLRYLACVHHRGLESVVRQLESCCLHVLDLFTDRIGMGQDSER